MTINCLGNLIDLDQPRVMGILNLTPDSFYDGGSYSNDKAIFKQVEKMLNDGATFIDIGGQSTRPTSDFLTADVEAKRILPVIEELIKQFPDILISVDTFYSQVARQSVEAGAALINDISAGHLDENMLSTVAELQVPYIMMHMRGTPQTMQTMTDYDNMIQEICLYFSERINQAHRLGLNDIIIDPGFGFSKTVPQNFELIRNLDLFKTFDLPILMGLSRKSSICKTLAIKPTQALNGTSVLNTLSLANGAQILRVHDVREAWECIELIKAYQG